jgi:DNA-binding FadR family transcriptional regulator
MNDSASTVSKRITSNLLARITNGSYPPGSKLPTEREIAEEFGVTRNVVREALKRLEALGLITIRRGSGIYAEDLRITGGAELLDILLKKEDGSIDVNMLRDIIEFYEITIVNIVKLATQRISARELAVFEELVKSRHLASNNHSELERISRDIVASVISATHNSFYRLLYNTMLSIPVLSTGFFAVINSNPDMEDYFERLAEAFRRRDHEMAGLLTTRMFETYQEETEKLLLRLSKRVTER